MQRRISDLEADLRVAKTNTPMEEMRARIQDLESQVRSLSVVNTESKTAIGDNNISNTTTTAINSTNKRQCRQEPQP